jgi:hypothetical protein
LPSPIILLHVSLSPSETMNFPILCSQPPRVADQALLSNTKIAPTGGSVLNKMKNMNNSLKLYQYCTPHEALLPPSCVEKDTKIYSHRLWESTTTSAALELINCDHDFFEKFPKIEWCDDAVENECSGCTITVTKKRDPIKPRRSCCKEKTNGIVAPSCHHRHGLVRSMCIRSRLSVLAGPPEQSCLKRNDDEPTAASAVIRAAPRQNKRRAVSAAHGEQRRRGTPSTTGGNQRIVHVLVIVA